MARSPRTNVDVRLPTYGPPVYFQHEDFPHTGRQYLVALQADHSSSQADDANVFERVEARMLGQPCWDIVLRRRSVSFRPGSRSSEDPSSALSSKTRWLDIDPTGRRRSPMDFSLGKPPARKLTKLFEAWDPYYGSQLSAWSRT